jgi:hypothetical protein
MATKQMEIDYKGQRAADLLLKLNGMSKERVRAATVELAQSTQYLTKKDIAAWRNAWQMAINIENPSRVRLYSIYTDTLADLHLSGCIQQRTEMVLQKAFRLCSIKDNKENLEATELLENKWYKDFVRFALESVYWGHSLIQFGDVINSPAPSGRGQGGGAYSFANVEVVPRAHVIPEYGVIVRTAGDEWKKGINYRQGKISEWCIEAGNPTDLGLLLKCAPHTISKRNMTAYWDTFGEMFGMPMRIAKTMSRDKAEQAALQKALADMGAAFYALFPEGTDIEIKESSRGDAFEVYDRRIILANDELSKGILGQTLTIQEGSGNRALGEIHLEVLKNIVEADADFIRDIVNNKLLPFMSMHGFPVEGLRFEWDDTLDLKPEVQKEIEQMLLTAGYDIPAEYFTQRYNIPIAGKTTPQAGALRLMTTPQAWENPDFFV